MLKTLMRLLVLLVPGRCGGSICCQSERQRHRSGREGRRQRGRPRSERSQCGPPYDDDRRGRPLFADRSAARQLRTRNRRSRLRSRATERRHGHGGRRRSNQVDRGKHHRERHRLGRASGRGRRALAGVADGALGAVAHRSEYIRNYTSPVSDYSQVLQMAPGTFSISANGPGLGDTKTFFRGFKDGQYSMTYDGIPFNDTNDPTHHSWVFFPSQTIGSTVFERSPVRRPRSARRRSADR